MVMVMVVVVMVVMVMDGTHEGLGFSAQDNPDRRHESWTLLCQLTRISIVTTNTVLLHRRLDGGGGNGVYGIADCATVLLRSTLQWPAPPKNDGLGDGDGGDRMEIEWGEIGGEGEVFQLCRRGGGGAAVIIKGGKVEEIGNWKLEIRNQRSEVDRSEQIRVK